MRYELLRFLLVDDNPHMRVMLSEILKAIGVRHIYEAGDGVQGLQMLLDHPIDIIITDLAMQPLDGIDFVRLLRQAPESPNQMCPVIMITAHSTLSRVNEARDAGVNEFLAKPINPKGVIDRIHRVVGYPRAFVKSDGYVGPDRRRRGDPSYMGPFRRDADFRPQQNAAVRER